MLSTKSTRRWIVAICASVILPPTFAVSPVLAEQELAATASVFEQFESLKAENAFIKSRAELDQYIGHVGLGNTPLGKLSESSRVAFLSSLTFNEKGLTSLNYKVIENELTPTEIYRLTDLFGASRLTFMMQKARPATELDILLLNKGKKLRSDSLLKYLSVEKCADDSVAGDAACGKDWEGYTCAAKSICSKATDRVCMSSC